jgi:thiol:disulfide interchange protein
MGSLGGATDDPATWAASYQPGDRSGRAELSVTAEIARGWHIYSLTQKSGGPKPTRLRVTGPEGVEVVGRWQASETPKKSVPELYGGLTVEEHDGTVVFTVPLKVPPGLNEPVTVKVDALGCHTGGRCVPIQQTLVAKRGEPVASSEAEVNQPAATEAGPADESRAAERDGAESDPLADAEPFRDGDYVVRWKAVLEDSSVAPGGRTRLRFLAEPDSGFHVYTAAVDDSSSATNFVLSEKSGLRVGAPRTEDPVVDSAQLPGVTYHKGSVRWSLPVKVPKDAATGEHQLEGFIVYQACTETSCRQPTAAKFTATLMVSNEPSAAAGTSAVAFASASRPEALDLAATTDWVDKIAEAGGNRAAADESGANAGAVSDAVGDETERGGDVAGVEPAPDADALMPFPMILLLALLGGVVLNVMPCVLPVVGLKVMGFVKQAGEDHRRILTLNLAYIGGILSVFAVFAVLAVSLSFGWGEQLTYFPIRLGLTLVLFALALSYLGLWEIPVPGFASGRASQELQGREGLPGAFSKGVFATIMATPCSGPLLGYILGLTLAISSAKTFLIFMTVGAGMSLPYLMVGLRPSLIAWLPKPGPWMETIKQFLAFLFLATVAFLFSTFADDHKLAVFISLMGVWFGCWIIGLVPNWQYLGRRLAAWAVGIAVAALIGVAAFRYTEPSPEVLAWEPYDEARLEQLQSQGRTVLLDFGASWCANCIFNYETAINTEPTRELVDELDAVAMYADWTDGNERIKAKLKELDSISIPLLAIYPGDDPDDPIVLRDIVTQSAVLEALRQAGPSVSETGRKPSPDERSVVATEP